MNKFLPCEDGSYVNINFITNIGISNDNSTFDIVVFYNTLQSLEYQYLIRNVDSQDEAQEWLDKFMEKHGLLLEPITPSRCF